MNPDLSPQTLHFNSWDMPIPPGVDIIHLLNQISPYSFEVDRFDRADTVWYSATLDTRFDKSPTESLDYLKSYYTGWAADILVRVPTPTDTPNP